jgi:hypothetical protein
MKIAGPRIDSGFFLLSAALLWPAIVRVPGSALGQLQACAAVVRPLHRCSTAAVLAKQGKQVGAMNCSCDSVLCRGSRDDVTMMRFGRDR